MNRLFSAFIIFGLGLVCWNAPPAQASSGMKVRIEVIKASRDSTKVDPQLEYLVKELSPVLNFKGFSLIKTSESYLDIKDKSKLILSTGRILELQLKEFSENKARLMIKIVENGKEIFYTVVLLVNKGSVLIGGPPP